jgi:hypothetical protein
VERSDDGAAGEKVDSASPELSGLEPVRTEATPVGGLDDGVHDVQQFGHPLHLVQHHSAAFRVAADDVEHALGSRDQTSGDIGQQEVDDQRIRESAAQPGRFAGPAGAEEEELPDGGSRNRGLSSIFGPKKEQTLPILPLHICVGFESTNRTTAKPPELVRAAGPARGRSSRGVSWEVSSRESCAGSDGRAIFVRFARI